MATKRTRFIAVSVPNRLIDRSRDYGEPIVDAYARGDNEHSRNVGHYTPENCRWATRLEQSRNRRGIKLSPHKVRLIFASNQPDSHLAKKFGCVCGAIWNARNGLTWREVMP